MSRETFCTSGKSLSIELPPAFWQKRYSDFNVFSERKHAEKLKYLHNNPVKWGLVESAELRRRSSYRSYYLGEPGAVKLWIPPKTGYPFITQASTAMPTMIR
jgi:hypothetical protein